MKVRFKCKNEGCLNHIEKELSKDILDSSSWHDDVGGNSYNSKGSIEQKTSSLLVHEDVSCNNCNKEYRVPVSVQVTTQVSEIEEQ